MSPVEESHRTVAALVFPDITQLDFSAGQSEVLAVAIVRQRSRRPDPTAA